MNSSRNRDLGSHRDDLEEAFFLVSLTILIGGGLPSFKYPHDLLDKPYCHRCRVLSPPPQVHVPSFLSRTGFSVISISTAAAAAAMCVCSSH